MFLDESSCGLGSWRTQIYTSCAVEYSQDTYKPLQAAIARFLRKWVCAGVGSLRVRHRWTWEESGMISCHNPKVLAIRTWDSSTCVPQDLDESSPSLPNCLVARWICVKKPGFFTRISCWFPNDRFTWEDRDSTPVDLPIWLCVRSYWLYYHNQSDFFCEWLLLDFTGRCWEGAIWSQEYP